MLRKDGLSLFSSAMDKDPTDMLFFDAGFSLFRHDEHRVLVCSSCWLLELDFGGASSARTGSIQSWCNAITVTAQLSSRTREQRFGSFAPIRSPAPSKPGDQHMLRGSHARFLLGGRATFRKIAEAILLARHEIFILGWFITPHLPLVRQGEGLPGDADPRLSALLRGAADRGVRVCVLLFHETIGPNDSEYVESELCHPNVFVVRHRSRFSINRLWSHHEKVVVVDQQLAFVGGIDLSLGRYDDSRRRLCDSPAGTWAGQDYSNPRIRDFADVRGNADVLDRSEQPRMPWQDVHCTLLGRPARDVARHCIERWNHAKSKQPQYCGHPTMLLRRKVAVCNTGMLALTSERGDPNWPPEYGDWHECTSQVLRSVGQWSAGTRMESSVHTAYCDLVQDAERFVYIENQFFCSGVDDDDGIGNRVVEALCRRVVRAHSEQAPFHVMVVLPLLPALDGQLASPGTALLSVVYWQLRSLRAFRQRLEDAEICFSDYVSIFGLRQHDSLDGVHAVTEQIYVHSKVMVVDDKVAIIGSANLNDRSLLGMRDSEVNVVLRDMEGSEAGGLACGLRRALFAQHIGWSRQELDAPFADPLGPAALGEIQRIARRNTEVYDDLFGPVPSNRIRSWGDLAALQAAGRPIGDAARAPRLDEASALADIRGHLVEFPLDFLADEDLAPPTFSVGGLQPDCFN